MALNDDTGLANLSGLVARRLAARVSRRTFMARLGQGMIALSLGSAGAVAFAEGALADPVCACGRCTSVPFTGESCCGRNSVTCRTLTGTNACPSGTCICGCWWVNVSTSSCASGLLEWCDCCGACQSGGACACVTGSDGRRYPTCCTHKWWTSKDVCGDCTSHIKCRRQRCISSTYTTPHC